MKLYLINLISFGLRTKWGYLGYKHNGQKDNIYKYITQAELDDIKLIINDKNNRVVLYAVSEGWSADAIINILEHLNVTTETSNVKLIVDSCAIDWIPDNHLNFPTIYYSHDMMKVANYEDHYGCNTEINLDTGKFLYLMGKPYKPQRVGLLHKLYCSGLLEHCEWSFKITDGIYEKTRNILPELSKEEFDSFVSKTLRNIDDINTEQFGSDRYFYEGIPYDHTMYAKTSFSLISETIIMPKCITEKTWRTISNRHAFVTLGDTDFFKWLNSIGLNTFDHLRVDDSNNHYIDNGIASVKTMLERINDSSENTKKAIESNYENYRRLVALSRGQVDEVIEPYLVQPRDNNPTRIILVEGSNAIRAIDKLWCPLQESNSRPTDY